MGSIRLPDIGPGESKRNYMRRADIGLAWGSTSAGIEQAGPRHQKSVSGKSARAADKQSRRIIRQAKPDRQKISVDLSALNYTDRQVHTSRVAIHIDVKGDQIGSRKFNFFSPCPEKSEHGSF
jgi:hypothetical protein